MPDEKVWWLREWVRVDNRTPGALPVRMQSIAVNRNDSIAWFDRVMGLDAEISGNLIQFWGGWEYSAAEACEIADRLRDGRPEQEEPSDLIGQYQRELDEKRNLVANRSIFGPDVRIQRNYL